MDKEMHRKLSIIKAEKGFNSLSMVVEFLVDGYESENRNNIKE